MIFILRSPFHFLASKSTLLITFTGSKSRKSYTTPVNYVFAGDIFYIVSLHSRKWWRNLRGNAQVSICLKGQDLKAVGKVIEDYESVTKELKEYLQIARSYAKYFKVDLDAMGNPNPEDVALAAKDRVMIHLRLNN